MTPSLLRRGGLPQRVCGFSHTSMYMPRRTISYTYGRVDNPYQTIASQPEAVTNELASELELRAKEQGALRMELLGGKLKGTVLEVGTGTGAVAREIGKMDGVSSVIGIDPSQAFLEKAKVLGGAKEQYIEAYSTNLSGAVADASIDHALLWTTLMHIPVEDHATTFAELLRVLKPGGVLHLLDNDPHSLDFRMHAHDPLAAPVQAWMDAMVQDKFVLRRAPHHLLTAGFKVQPLKIHTILDTSAESYGYQGVLVRAIEAFSDMNVVAPPMIDAMKVEAERRVAAGQFQMALSYVYITANKPE